MKIAIVGAGLTGLAAAYRLSGKGHAVTVFEKEKTIGGLAAGFRQNNWSWCLDNYFHHLFTSDKHALLFVDELGLKTKLLFPQAKTSIFYNGQICPFDSPTAILKFPFLSWPAKIRTGLVTVYLRTISDWSKFEKTTADKWLPQIYGQETFRRIWQPLLKSKFGPSADQVSAVWFWSRIKKRSFKLGYLKGGLPILIDKLTASIKQQGGRILIQQEVTGIQSFPNGQFKPTTDSSEQISTSRFDRIIFTTPTSIFFKIITKNRKFATNLSTAWQKQMTGLKMVGAINLILVLKKPFLTDGTYWLNINEPGFPFVAVVEHTNLFDPAHYGGNHLLYVGGYYPQNHRYFKTKKEIIFRKFLPYLKTINPRHHLSPISYHLSRNKYAQPVIPVNYSRIVPQMKTPIKHIFFANMQMIYPHDRGINYAVDLGEKVANEVIRSI